MNFTINRTFIQFSLFFALFLHFTSVLKVVGVRADGDLEPEKAPSFRLSRRDDPVLEPFKSFKDGPVTPGFSDWSPDSSIRSPSCPRGYGYCRQLRGCCRLGGYCCNSTRSCCNPGYHCCSFKGCCQDGYNCVTIHGQNGCCPVGRRCIRDGVCRTAGYRKCRNENFCCPPGYKCFRDEYNRPRCRRYGGGYRALEVDGASSTSEAPPTSTATGDNGGDDDEIDGDDIADDGDNGGGDDSGSDSPA